MEKRLRNELKEKLTAYRGSRHTKNVPGRTTEATYLNVNVVKRLATQELIEGGMADGLEDELKAASYATKRIILQAVIKGGNFYKEVPPEVQQFITNDPAKAMEFFKDKAHKYPEIMRLIQQRLQKSEAPRSHTEHADEWKQKMVKDIVSMQKLVRDRALHNLHLVIDLDTKIVGNSAKDWDELTKLMAPQVVQAIRDNTSYTAAEFFKAFSNVGGDLSKLITVDRIL